MKIPSLVARSTISKWYFGYKSIHSMAKLSHDDVMKVVKSVVPPLDYSMHKGQAGRVAVVGGCKEYTGAPYFAAITALKVGADLSHVFCVSDAATVIKSYSPELIVHPLLDQLNAVSKISEWLPRFHSLVVGPGLGRDENILTAASGVIQKAKEQKIPIVIDADGIFLVTQDPSVIDGYTGAVLTPNVAEFERLYKRVLHCDPDPNKPMEMTTELSKRLGNVTIIHKGHEDIITNGEHVIACSETGSPRRCGGQGDLLSGSLGIFLCWARQSCDIINKSGVMKSDCYGMCAAYAACVLTRECNRRAFMEHGRSMTTSDMISVIHTSFESLFS
ncbi:ATP-dependent (S)-NAD(P)H-hydrate dehydratase-like [Physella acuta]|uniref:ATP-dependent (S)-NAD(P)H-hydrate dehydratase-like n=1 Tax=Physella acuta TaxID=109671 RepID=UPI0027DB9031|nr:ATP-dependent (S)-NAD(P)H-hydrate dehydratase-like [Physella acuta]